MIVKELKLKGKPQQYRVIDDTIRTAQFVRNKALRYWIDNQGAKLSDLYKQCVLMAKEFEWAGKLNSMARQAMAQRAILLSNIFFLIAKPRSQGRRGIHNSKSTLAPPRVQDFRLEAF
jgi:putative transposase